MARTARMIGGSSIVLAPLVAGIGGALVLVARPDDSAGIVDTEYGVESQLTDIAAVAANEGLFTLASWLFYLSTLLTIPASVAIWRLAVGSAPRWAWAGAVMAALGLVGQVVHLGYYAGMLTAARVEDRTGAAEFLVAQDSTPFVLALFVPFFFSLLCVFPQAVGLRRARVIPTWAATALVVAAGIHLVTGNLAWSLAAWTVLTVAGFTPAARAMLRSTTGDDRREPTAAEAAVPA